MGEWQPVHDKHAIAVVAMVVAFSGELPQRLASKLQEQATALAGARGLSNSSPIQGFAINPDRGIAATAENIGIVLSSVKDIPTVPGHPLDFSRQLHVERNSIMYRTSVYKSWSEMRKDLEDLVAPLLQIVSDVIGVQSIRLEYLDKFTFSGEVAEASTAELISANFKMVSPHIFSNPDNWHSHIGSARLLESGKGSAILHVNVDSNTLSHRASSGTRTMRTVSLMTAREDRNPFGGVADSDYNADIVLNRLDEMHTELKKLIKDMLVTSMREKIGLEEQ